ncbi:MAG TPA: DUF5668 domain-containing protein [Roseiflexaceae bacterium]|nr:DUF5668 domain-containing protein [Roseiflexaceae bacterium]
MNATTSVPMNTGRRRGLVGPVILLVLGVLLLLNNLGMLDWAVWATLARWWPLLLIAAGLDLVLGNRSRLASLLIVVALLLAFGFLLWQSASWQPAGVPVASRDLVQTLDGADKAEVRLSMGAGNLQIATFSSQGDATLIRGTIESLPDQVVRSFNVVDGTAIFALRSRSMNALPFIQRGQDALQHWDLRLNGSVPVNLAVTAGAGNATIKLRDAHVTNLDLNGGVGTMIVEMPRHGVVTASVSCGVGNTTVTIPAGMAARITASNGVGQVNVVGAYERKGAVYQTVGYDQAPDRLDLRLTGGVGNATITLEPGR